MFNATLASLDPQWAMILKGIEDMDEEIIKSKQEEEMKEKWGDCEGSQGGCHLVQGQKLPIPKPPPVHN